MICVDIVYFIACYRIFTKVIVSHFCDKSYISTRPGSSNSLIRSFPPWNYIELISHNCLTRDWYFWCCNHHICITTSNYYNFSHVYVYNVLANIINEIPVIKNKNIRPINKLLPFGASLNSFQIKTPQIAATMVAPCPSP